jgi:hypothetical protein
LDADEVKEEPSEIIMKRVMSAEASVLQSRISRDEIKNIYEL